jgi:dihydroorotate dehydrogenase electron transfer subunit
LELNTLESHQTAGFSHPRTPRNQFEATVGENALLCRDHYRLTLRVSGFPATKPGQFIQISCQDLEAEMGEMPELKWSDDRFPQASGMELCEAQAMLRRPFSLAGRRDNGGVVELDIIHRVVGLATHWLQKLGAGDRVNILGPLGNAFVLPPKGGTALLVGGGVGIPPMIYLAGALANHKAVAFAGATTRDLLSLTVQGDQTAEFGRHNIPTIIATDDGSLGFRGFVTQALEKYLDEHRPTNPTIYVCGPELMMKRVAEIALSRNIPCQVAVERAMACGMGTCQSCCIRVRKPDPALPPLPGKDWSYRLACTDGPIFAADRLLW